MHFLKKSSIKVKSTSERFKYAFENKVSQGNY